MSAFPPASFAVLQAAEFALQAVLRLEPGLPALAVALLENEPRRSPLIAACTAAAAATGVVPGLTAPQAMARCPGLIVRASNPDAEREAQAALLAAAFSLSPAVEETAPGVCTANLSGLPEPRRASALAAALASLTAAGLSGTAGLAPTPLLALYAARAASPALAIVRDGRSFLAPLPIAAAEPPPALAIILAQWGIRTLGEFAALPKAEILHRLGAEGAALWERCSGEETTPRPLKLAQLPRTFSATFDSEHPLETLDPVLFILRRLVDRLALDLQNAALAARELLLRLTLGDETSHTHAIRLPLPTHQADVLFRALVTHLEHLRTASAITAVALAIEPARILLRQEGLFDSALRDPHGFGETLARAAALTGPDRVGTPALEDTHRSDAFRLGAPAETLPGLLARFTPPVHGLALRRLRPPVPLAVELAGRQPAYVWATGAAATAPLSGRVSGLRGPWYGSGDWWEAGKGWEREDWDVELDTGGLYRLFRTPSGWFLDGEYD